MTITHKTRIAGYTQAGKQSLITVADNGEVRLDGSPIEQYRTSVRAEVYSFLAKGGE